MSDSSDKALSIRLEQAQLAELIDAAGRLRDEGHGRNLSYSRKVFIPLTHLCRDVCHYCTFAERPRAGRSAYLSADEVLAMRARRSGCGLHGGALHARRQAGASLPRGSGGARRAGAQDHDRLSPGCAHACCARPGFCRTPTPESRAGQRSPACVPSPPAKRDHAGIAQRTPLRTRRRALWLT